MGLTLIRKELGAGDRDASRVMPSLAGLRSCGEEQTQLVEKADSCYCEPAWRFVFGGAREHPSRRKVSASQPERERETNRRGLSASVEVSLGPQ
jgi:hypothetical protein